MTDSSGAVVWSADYKPFGETTITVSTITNNLRFPGQYYDAETGLNYNYMRDYNPVIGRYIEADPIGTDSSLITSSRDIFSDIPEYFQPYVYVANKPLRLIDPSGLLPKKKQCTMCDPAEKAAVQQRLNDVSARLSAGNFGGSPGKEWGHTECHPYGSGFKVKQDLPSNCVYNCVWEHENKHYQDCMALKWYDRSNGKIAERPGWEAEKKCLQDYLSQ